MPRVLFQARPDVFSVRGGDTVQMEGTRKYLTRKGVQIDFAFSDRVDCSSYDLVHLFNVTRPEETWLQLQNAKRQLKPVCLSTIYWNMEALDEQDAPFRVQMSGLERWMRSTAKALLQRVSEGYRLKYAVGKLRQNESLCSLQRHILESVDMLLPNSQAELEQVHRDFPITRNMPAYVVYNGVDREVFCDTAVSRNWGALYGLEQFAACVGRIEPRKNQLRLVRGMFNSRIPLVLVGKPNNAKYVAEVRKCMKPEDRLFVEVGQQDLRQIYAAARVHVLPSFYETPGLSSLEAGVLGCNLAMSEIGSQREYFGDEVEYCDPNSEGDICSAVERAWERPWPNSELASAIRAKYSWEVAADKTLEAYRYLLRRL